MTKEGCLSPFLALSAQTMPITGKLGRRKGDQFAKLHTEPRMPLPSMPPSSICRVRIVEVDRRRCYRNVDERLRPSVLEAVNGALGKAHYLTGLEVRRFFSPKLQYPRAL